MAIPFTLLDAELIDLVKNKAVKKLIISQNEAGGYFVAATLTWKEGIWNLTTTRGMQRNWASLDRLVRHMHEVYGENIPRIELILKHLAT